MKLEAKDLGPVADPLPYLYRMANNLMLDRYRSATRRERREQDWAEGAGGVMALAARYQQARSALDTLDALMKRPRDRDGERRYVVPEKIAGKLRADTPGPAVRPAVLVVAE